MDFNLKLTQLWLFGVETPKYWIRESCRSVTLQKWGWETKMTRADAESHYYNLTELVCTSSACFQNTRYLANYVIQSESIENQNNQQFVISQNQNCVLCLEMYSFIKWFLCYPEECYQEKGQGWMQRCNRGICWWRDYEDGADYDSLGLKGEKGDTKE